jgi:AcrR family transcriptional regulator
MDPVFDDDVNVKFASPGRAASVTEVSSTGPDLKVENGPEPKTAGPRSRKGVETRARLVAAAKAVFERDGFLDARISDISEQAGLSHGSFYHYFESKEQVFREVATEADELLASPISDVILDPSSPATPQERIRKAIRLYLERYRDEARIMSVIEQVSRFDPQLRALRGERHRTYLAQVAGSIAALQRHGLVDQRLDPAIVSAGLGSMTYRFPELWFVEGLLECSLDHGAEQLALLFLRAMGLPEGISPEDHPPAGEGATDRAPTGALAEGPVRR